jgi:hypothetical protein
MSRVSGVFDGPLGLALAGLIALCTGLLSFG